MILDYYGLREQPFGVTPDPAYLYPSQTHCAALDSLSDAILSDRGFVALISEPGMGKTTLLHQVMEGMRDTARGVFLFQTQCDSREFFQYLMSELGVDFTRMGLVAMHNKLNEILFAEMLAGRRFVLIVDEAQNLEDSVLETIRLLSNFETSHSKLMQIVLAGQPQLGEKLRQKHLAQLLQRLTTVQYLEPFSPEETAGYIRHRLKVAGYRREPLFDDSAVALIAERSQGFPRDINKICFRTLLEGYAAESTTLSTDLVEKAIGRLTLIARNRPQALPPLVLPAPADALPPNEPQRAAAAAASATPRLSYPVSKPSRWKPWGTGGAGGAVLLLAAGLLLPHSVISRVSQSVQQKLSATKNFLQQGTSRISGVASALHRSSGTSAPPAENAAQANAASVASTKNSESPAGASVAPNLASSAATGAYRLPSFEQGYAELGRTPDPASLGPRFAPAPYDPQLSLARQLGLKINRIAIDPGHGGYDTGTAGPSGLLEKDLCLDVALRLGQLIRQNLPGTQVVYTRSDDRHVSLEERTAIANDANADLFISVHANSSDYRYIRGAETFYLSLADSREARDLASRENAVAESSLHDLPDLLRKITRDEKVAASRQLAADIQQSLSSQLQTVSRQETNRGVKHAPFLVLTGANMPAVLSEISFVSNATDESLLLESTQRQRIAEALFRGISTYLNRLPASQPPKPNQQREGTAFATPRAPGKNAGL
ncbi:MAG TPA: N-acetylmuramoyl-L-alanine amidase [Terriglobales bacterium]|nr:N-acetylmuramoyl-L-alanine amidase [Terriglobales bacterium]